MAHSDAVVEGRGLRPLIVLPTYNEAANLAGLVTEILAVVPFAHVLVVDDDSPDGTGAIADRLARSDVRVAVRHRRAKRGLGAAYKLGLQWGLQRGFDPLFEMDADTSHHPCYLPDFLDAITDGADLVIGSRLIPGGGIDHWPLHRQLLSRGSNAITHALLKMPIKDATSGFRAYRADVLRSIDLHTIEAEGYSFQVEMAFRVWRAGFGVTETPIVFTDRVMGASKISRFEVLSAMGTLARLWWADRHGRIPVSKPVEVRV